MCNALLTALAADPSGFIFQKVGCDPAFGVFILLWEAGTMKN